jgi:hypothetical protein
MDDELKIWKASAAIRETATLNLVEWIAEKVAIGEPGTAAHYFQNDRRASFVMSDGKLVTRFTVQYLTEEEARDIATEFDSSVFWSSREFHDMVNRVLGTSASRVQ